ncbi:hypothetical protein Tco_1122350 [Tanacetum coccineum]|uniref:Integrase, catalytic region, zinc finger, CCHC-type, peptidase aspartic, catalytic n=1 Tax=Tanacetum coccineum TaxID=301880 RepID=A0ABQ5J1Q7_9ASTR
MDSIILNGQKNTLAENMILSGADNRPPMLDKDLYDSWQSRMKLYMENREHGRMILKSVKYDPLIWPTIEENGVIRTKKYAELSAAEKIQADCDVKATNIILQGLPTDIYALINHHRVAKDLWERVQLLMQGTSLTKHERECKLYDAFDKFAYIKGESLHQYYLRFAQLMNNMNIYKMTLQQFQVNTKFLNSLLTEWSKFVMDVKLVKDLHITNFDHIHAYLEQHELHTNEVRLMRERNQNPLFSPSQSPQYGSIHPTQHYSTTYPSTPFANSYPSTPYPNAYSSTVHQKASLQPPSVPQIEYTISTINQQAHMAEFPQIDSGLVVPVFKQGDDPINSINKMMSFLSTVVTSRQQRVVKCFNCQGEGYMARQYPKPKRKRDATWFREKILLVEAQGNAYQANDLDAYDSDCDEISTAKAVLMDNLSRKGPNWLFDLDYLTDSMNYHSVRSENQANLHAGQQETNQNTGTKDKIDAGDSEKEDESAQDCFELPIWHSYSSTNPFASKSDNKIGGPREEEQVHSTLWMNLADYKGKKMKLMRS